MGPQVHSARSSAPPAVRLPNRQHRDPAVAAPADPNDRMVTQAGCLEVLYEAARKADGPHVKACYAVLLAVTEMQPTIPRPLLNAREYFAHVRNLKERIDAGRIQTLVQLWDVLPVQIWPRNADGQGKVESFRELLALFIKHFEKARFPGRQSNRIASQPRETVDSIALSLKKNSGSEHRGVCSNIMQHAFERLYFVIR